MGTERGIKNESRRSSLGRIAGPVGKTDGGAEAMGKKCEYNFEYELRSLSFSTLTAER